MQRQAPKRMMMAHRAPTSSSLAIRLYHNEVRFCHRNFKYFPEPVGVNTDPTFTKNITTVPSQSRPTNSKLMWKTKMGIQTKESTYIPELLS